MNRIKKQTDLIEIVDRIGIEIDTIVIEKKENQYFEGIILSYSFIENILKYIVFLNRAWEQNCIDVENNTPSEENFVKILNECSQYSFYYSNKKAVELKLISDKLFSTIEKVRKERNDIIHQFWLYSQRKNSKLLRRKLKSLILITKKLLKKLGKIAGIIGVDEIFDISIFFQKSLKI